MMKKLLLALPIFFLAFQLSAQRNAVQEGLDQLRSADSDTMRIRIHMDIASAYSDIDSDSSLIFYKKALEVAESGGYTGQEAKAWRKIAATHLDLDQYEESLQAADKAIELFNPLNEAEQIVKAKLTKGKVYIHLAMYPEALSNYLEALESLENNDDPFLLCRTLNSVGEVYRHLEEVDTAISYYERALNIIETMENHGFAAGVLNNLSLAYRQKDNYPKAREMLFRALEIAEADGYPRGISIICNNIGLVYYNEDKHELALKYYFRALEIKEEIGDLAGKAYSLNDIGQVYQSLKDSALAFDYSKRALKIAEEIGALYLLRNINRTLADGHHQFKEFERAYFYEKAYSKYNDSIFREDRNKEISRLEESLRVNRAESKNRLLASENKFQEQTIKRQEQENRWMVIGLILVMGLMTIIIFSWLFIRRANLRVRTTNAQLKSSNEKLEELNHNQRQLMAAVVHDLNAPLNKVKALIGLIEDAGPTSSDQEESIQMIRKEVSNGIDFVGQLLEMERLEQAEGPLDTQDFDLVKLLKELIDGYQGTAGNKNIKLELITRDPECKVNSNSDYMLRIIQNLVSNAIKFSPPGKSVTLEVACTQDKVKIVITDEGPGFSAEDQKNLFKKFQKLSARPTAGESSNGLGLSITKALIEKLNGHISLNSKPGQGASFLIELPKN